MAQRPGADHACRPAPRRRTARPGAAELLKTVRANPDLLITDPSKDFRSFRITQIAQLGTKRGTGRGGFIDSVADAVDTFYVDVLQRLRAWNAPPPKLREEPDAEPVPDALTSTALSSQDEPEPTTPDHPSSDTPPCADTSDPSADDVAPPSIAAVPIATP